MSAPCLPGTLRGSSAADVLVVCDPRGRWVDLMRGAFGEHVAILTPESDAQQRAEAARRAEVAVIDASLRDPLRIAAELWRVGPHLSIVLSGEGLSPELRAAATEAGVAHITATEPGIHELRAIVQCAAEQNRSGSPELLRTVCAAMCTLSATACTGDQDDLLQAAVREIARVFRAEKVSVQLLQPDGSLGIAAQLGLVCSETAPPRNAGIAEAVARSGEPRITLRNVAADATWEARSERGISASMCVPLTAGHAGGPRIRGVLNVARVRAHSIFTPRDLDVAASVASLLAEALDGIDARRLAAETERRAAAVERLATVGELAAGIAHEVANPLAFVRSNVESLAEYLRELSPVLSSRHRTDPLLAELIEDLPHVVAETLEGVLRAESVVRQVKSLVRLNNDTSRDDIVPLADVLATTLRFLRTRLPTVNTQIDPDAVIRGCAAELQQVFINLLANAADACAERAAVADASYRPQVDIIVERCGTEVVAVVEDNGIGMVDEIAARVFMPLFTTKGGEQGTGLGLPMVRRLVERHRGVIRLSSRPGSGTRFVISWPANGEAAVAPLTCHQPARVAGGVALNDEHGPPAQEVARPAHASAAAGQA